LGPKHIGKEKKETEEFGESRLSLKDHK